MVDGGERGDVADELVQQRGLQQVRLLGDERLVGQHHLLGGRGVRRQQPPVDEAAVPKILFFLIYIKYIYMRFRHLKIKNLMFYAKFDRDPYRANDPTTACSLSSN